MMPLVYLGFGLMLASSVIRTRSDASFVIAAAYMLSMIASEHHNHEALRPILAAIDAGVVLAMSGIWRSTGDYKCRILGTIAMASMCLSVLSSISSMSWQTYSTAANVASFIQIIIVGGFADGFMAWLGRGFERITRRNNRFFRFVGAY